MHLVADVTSTTGNIQLLEYDTITASGAPAGVIFILKNTISTSLPYLMSFYGGYPATYTGTSSQTSWNMAIKLSTGQIKIIKEL